MLRNPEGFVTEDRAAEIVGLSRATLERLRWTDDGPPARRYRGRVIYDESELRTWVRAQARPWHEARRDRLAGGT